MEEAGFVVKHTFLDLVGCKNELDEPSANDVPKQRARSYSDSAVDWSSTESEQDKSAGHKNRDSGSGSTTAGSLPGTPPPECVDLSSSEEVCFARPRLNTEPLMGNVFLKPDCTQASNNSINVPQTANLGLMHPQVVPFQPLSPSMQTMYVLSVNPDGTQMLMPMSANLTNWNQPTSVAQPVCKSPAQPTATTVKLGALLPENSSTSLETRAAALSAYAAEVRAEARRAKAAAAAARRKGLHDTTMQDGAQNAQLRQRARTDGNVEMATKEMLDSSTAEVITEGNEPIVKSQWDDREEIENDDRTTLMFRNLPNNYTRSALLAMLDNEGFNGDYSFVYLPTDFKNFAGFGYAFVNFAVHSGAKRAKKHFQGFSRWNMPSRKVCDVVWSGPVQGLQAHTERYRNSPVMHDSVPDEYKPVVFMNGIRVPFPAPTKRIRPPRVRQPIAAEPVMESATSRRVRTHSDVFWHH